MGFYLRRLKVSKFTFREFQSNFSQHRRHKQPPLLLHLPHQMGHPLKLPIPHPSLKLLRLWQTSLHLSRKINLPILRVASKPLLITEILRALLIFAQPDVQPLPSTASAQSFRPATNDGCFPRSIFRFSWPNATANHCLPSVLPVSPAQCFWSATAV
jgi:hypothetical protein